jgi:hypothetical protein
MKSGHPKLPLGDNDFGRHLKADLQSIELDDQGYILWSTCSEHVKRVAMNLGATSRCEITPIQPTGTVDLKNYNLELFARMDDAFCILTDCAATSYSNLEEFHEEFQKSKYGKDRLRIFSRKINQLFGFYQEEALHKEVAIPQYSGNFVLSGQRFYRETLSSVSSMALYTDSILIPDPILPWLERDRTEESSPNAEMFDNLFHVLQLAPLISPDIPGTPVALFPTWSKTREMYSAVEQWQMDQAVAKFFSHFLECDFVDIGDVQEFCRIEKKRFREKIAQHNLFQPFGGTGDMTNLDIETAVSLQRKNYNENRSPEFAEQLAALSDEFLIFLNIRERLNPVHQLVAQCTEFGGQPMSWLPAQWYFLKKYFEGLGGHELDNETRTTLEALDDPSLRWLSNVPIDVLARLRREGANSEFRTRLHGAIEELAESRRSNSKACVHQVSRTLHSMVTEHQLEIEKITEKYQNKYKQIAVTGWTGVAATFMPATLPIWAAVVPGTLFTKYVNDKLSERFEVRKAKGSLLGVLAAAARRQ